MELDEQYRQRLVEHLFRSLELVNRSRSNASGERSTSSQSLLDREEEPLEPDGKIVCAHPTSPTDVVSLGRDCTWLHPYPRACDLPLPYPGVPPLAPRSYPNAIDSVWAQNEAKRAAGFRAHPPCNSLDLNKAVYSPHAGLSPLGVLSPCSSGISDMTAAYTWPEPEPAEVLTGTEGAYQPYCNQIINDELNFTAQRLLSRLKELTSLEQGMAPGFSPPRRFFCSLKEVSKVVPNAALLIVAPDVRPSATAAIKPVKILTALLSAAARHGVPVVFALSRRGIGQVFGREKSMSIVAVSAQGLDTPHR